MNEATPFLGFLTVSLMIALSPGPSWAYTISTTLGHGRKCGMIGNLGNSAGILCHALAVALGLAAVLQFSTAAFQSLKILGAIYLCYLAFQAIRGSSALNKIDGAPKASPWILFRNGAFASIFNPKISLLMLALLPQFVNPTAAHPELQIAFMGVIHAVVAAVVHTHLILFAGSIAKYIKGSGRVKKVLRWATAAVFLGFSARLVIANR